MSTSSLLEQLKGEHADLKKLFATAENCKEKKRSNIIQQIKKEYIPHARGEEKTIYSFLKDRLDDEQSFRNERDCINEAFQEHWVIDNLLSTLEYVDTGSENWSLHLTVLKENIYHHMQEEEDSLFFLIEKHFSEEKLKDIKSQYIKVKSIFAETMPSQSQVHETQPMLNLNLDNL